MGNDGMDWHKILIGMCIADALDKSGREKKPQEDIGWLGCAVILVGSLLLTIYSCGSEIVTDLFGRWWFWLAVATLCTWAVVAVVWRRRWAEFDRRDDILWQMWMAGRYPDRMSWMSRPHSYDAYREFESWKTARGYMSRNESNVRTVVDRML